MTIYPEIEAFHGELTTLRRDIHKHPELAYEEHRTAELVADALESYGIEVTRGVGKTGVVGKLTSGGGNRAFGLRADMDALPMDEANDFAHKSVHEGAFHGCGHDGHTVMLLGAAKHLAETRDFDGTVYFIFQPAEEGGAGGKAMIDDGMFERFPMEAVFGMHNMPGLPVGHFAVRSGPMMASVANFDIDIEGVGGHGAMPHRCIDPVPVASEIVLALQNIVARTLDPIHAGVVSVTQIHGGSAYNVIPDKVRLSGCTRYFSDHDGKLIENRMRQIAENIAAAHGIKATLNYRENYPVLVNSAEETDHCVQAAADLVGAASVHVGIDPVMGSEDFAFMLKEKPGCYILIGNGDGQGGCMVHHPEYDFNDEVLPLGASYWVKLTESLLAHP
ncbi:MAG: amidohydrolase [Alphaproteobacteria bacterium]|nr:MAG: amidohydrolase [Alphaproteobacteria bacterium]